MSFEMNIPDRTWPLLTICAKRTETIDFSLYDKDGNAMAIESSDVVRFKMSDAVGKATPDIDADSLTPPATASYVLIDELGDVSDPDPDNWTPASGRVIVTQADTNSLTAGDFYGELLLVDDSETNPANAIKPIIRGPITLLASQGGDVGLT